MPNLPISGLPAAAALDGSELVPVEQTGTTVHTTTQAIANLGGGGGGGPAIARATLGSTGNIQGSSAGIADVEWDCSDPSVFIINFIADYFGSAPQCVATAIFDGIIRICTVESPQLLECIVHVADVDGNPAQGGFCFIATGAAGPPI